MATFQKAGPEIKTMADGIIELHESHHPLRDRKLRIDFVFAFGERDETTNELNSCAIKKGGYQVFGLCRKVSLKDRAKGMGDAEITLDHDHWELIDEEDQIALLDHELHHIVVTAKNDDLGRPILKMRKHDVEIGWFKVIADRNGANSVEQQQAKTIFDTMGQSFWPGLGAQQRDSAEIAAHAVRKTR